MPQFVLFFICQSAKAKQTLGLSTGMTEGEKTACSVGRSVTLSVSSVCLLAQLVVKIRRDPVNLDKANIASSYAFRLGMTPLSISFASFNHLFRLSAGQTKLVVDLN